MILQDADVFIPAAIPNVIDAFVAPRLKVKLVAEGANNAVAPRVEETLHRQGILYLPGQAMNWGGVHGSTLEVLFRELTKRRGPLGPVEQRIREALEPLSTAVDVPWTLELLRSGLPGPPLDLDETRAFAIAILEDLARSNTRWLMDELVASRYGRPPLELVRILARSVRSLKVQLLSLIEHGLGTEFLAPGTSLRRLERLLDDKLKELLAGVDTEGLTQTQAIEQRQMLQRLQRELSNGLSSVLASSLAALDLARQKAMDPDSYSQASLNRDLATLQHPDTHEAELDGCLHRIQRIHPGANRSPRSSRPSSISSRTRRPPLAPRRNAALAVAKLGSSYPRHHTALLDALTDSDASVRATCRWALYQMAVIDPEEGRRLA